MTETVKITEFSGIKLTTPLLVSVIEIEGRFFTTSSYLEICADGSTPEETIDNFKSELEALYKRATKFMEMIE
jgi:4-hydroxy-3-methylbut-2-enyl diphosphate reductase IspH